MRRIQEKRIGCRRYCLNLMTVSKACYKRNSAKVDPWQRMQCIIDATTVALQRSRQRLERCLEIKIVCGLRKVVDDKTECKSKNKALLATFTTKNSEWYFHALFHSKKNIDGNCGGVPMCIGKLIDIIRIERDTEQVEY